MGLRGKDKIKFHKGGNSVKIVCLPSEQGSTLKGKNLLLLGLSVQKCKQEIIYVFLMKCLNSSRMTYNKDLIKWLLSQFDLGCTFAQLCLRVWMGFTN